MQYRIWGSQQNRKKNSRRSKRAEAAYDSNGDPEDKPATDLLESILVNEMGFEDFQDYGSYDMINNNINVRYNDFVGFAVARKEVGDYVIYCVPVKGTSGNSEWFSDINLGDPDNNGGWHEGFWEAANYVKAGLVNSLNRNRDRDSGKTRILWFTGHSRGAAVANLLAGQLSDTQSVATRDHIFCYTFACPNVGYTDNVVNYMNIVNYNNAGDLIPLLPMDNWGFGRYGRTFNTGLAGMDNFKRMREALYGRGYEGAANEEDWKNLLDAFFKDQSTFRENRPVSPIFRTVALAFVKT